MPIQSEQRVTAQPGWNEGPASGAVISCGHQQGEGVIQLTQSMHQPGAMGPRAASPDHQPWPLRVGTELQARLIWNQHVDSVARRTLVTPFGISRSKPLHQLAPLPPPALSGSSNNQRR